MLAMFFSPIMAIAVITTTSPVSEGKCENDGSLTAKMQISSYTAR